MIMRRPFCTVPFVEGFSGYGTEFRNCCAADPQITSLPGQTFSEWNQDARLIEFRERMYQDTWQPECQKCRRQEQESGHSFRTAVNQQVIMTENFGAWPSRWNLKFGNICNLACWTCDEQASSVIAQHKRTINILPEDFVDPEQQFQADWPALQQDVLHSYDCHELVTITLVGGEPMYNRTVIQFLEKLIDLGLAARTRLEFHTNGTKFNPKLLAADTWNYICVFLSLDAVGPKAEWLRYGCRWHDIESNIGLFKQAADYVEVHCTLSILNINDLSSLGKFCKTQDLPLKIMLLSSPDYMSILKWPRNPHLIINNDNQDNQFDYYYNLIGNNPDDNVIIQLQDYINQYSSIRHNLAKYDPELARVIGVSTH
jgi:organic radical activating enzyme